MMYAVVRTGGKQYRVKPGDKFTVEKITTDEQKINLQDVLLISEDGSDPIIGMPVIEGATIECDLIAQAKSKKIIVFKFKRRKRYMRKNGHRQQLTMLKVRNISYGDKVWKMEVKK